MPKDAKSKYFALAREVDAEHKRKYPGTFHIGISSSDLIFAQLIWSFPSFSRFEARCGLQSGGSSHAFRSNAQDNAGDSEGSRENDTSVNAVNVACSVENPKNPA